MMDKIFIKIEEPDSDDCQIEVKSPSHSQKKQIQPYAMVIFTDEENAPGIICSRWIKGENETFFPNVRTNEARDRILRKNRPHQSDWPICKIKVLHFYSTLNEARSSLPKVEEISSLESEEEKEKERPRRKRKPRSLLLPAETDSDEYTSSTPPSKKVSSFPKPSETFGTGLTSIVPGPSQQSTAVYVPTSVPSATGVTAVIPGPYQQPTTVYVPPSVPSATGLTPVIPGLYQQPTTLYVLTSVPSATGVAAVPSQQSTAVYGTASVPSTTGVTATIQSPSQQPATVQDNNSEKLYRARQSEWMSNVTKILQEMQKDIREIKWKFQPRGSSVSNLGDKLFGELPVESVDTLLELNQKVTEDSASRSSLIKILASVGGKDPRTMLFNALRRLMTDEVSVNFSLTGKINFIKRCFLNTELCKVLFVACRKVFDEVTDDTMKKVIGDFLHQAKVRIIRRSK